MWLQSFRQNIRCAQAIEEAIRQHFNGMYLAKDSAKDVINIFGYDRVFWVLANTLQYKDYDGRFSHENMQWAKTFDIPKEENNGRFAVESHPAVLDGFVNQVCFSMLQTALAAHQQQGVVWSWDSF